MGASFTGYIYGTMPTRRLGLPAQINERPTGLNPQPSTWNWLGIGVHLELADASPRSITISPTDMLLVKIKCFSVFQLILYYI